MAGNMKTVDFLVVGAGIAGASIAAELARKTNVLLVEMEAQPGYHTTGRSAAIFDAIYGPAPIRALSRASEAFFRNPPDGFSQSALTSPRHILAIARPDQLDILADDFAEFRKEGSIERLGGDEARKYQPLLREGYAAGAILDRNGLDIDVHALHHGFLKSLRSSGGELRTGAKVSAMARSGSAWRVEIGSEIIEAKVVVNAAGAWAEGIGQLGGAETIGLVAKRRTAMLVKPTATVDTDLMAMTVDIEEKFYLKPETGQLLLSPANEDPMAPCDVQPEEMDIAICIDRIERAFDLSVRRIENKWAGLRSFVADKSPVVGFSEQAEGFFWLAGQGGYGIQTAPALARYAAAMAMGDATPQDIFEQGLDPASLRPGRLS